MPRSPGYAGGLQIGAGLLGSCSSPFFEQPSCALGLGCNFQNRCLYVHFMCCSLPSSEQISSAVSLGCNSLVQGPSILAACRFSPPFEQLPGLSPFGCSEEVGAHCDGCHGRQTSLPSVVDGYGGTKAMLQDKVDARGLLVAELWSPPHPKPAPKGPALKDWLKKLLFFVSGVFAFSDPHALPIVEEVLSLVGLTGSGDVAADALLEQVGIGMPRAEVQTFVEAELSQKALVRQVFRSRPAGAEFMPVLVQEHLAGDEYAVDIVVRDGAMAVMSVFKHDVKALNGLEIVVLGVLIEPIQKGSPEEAVATYAMESLAALGMRNGPARVEVKMTLPKMAHS
ncbi:unnamed protein product [Symbiodinium microadriaticum]|nr:unnamed protein product [Symbiodinium microadriaticum]